MSGGRRDEDLAYGSYPAQSESQGVEGERGFVGDSLNSLLGRRPQGQQSVSSVGLQARRLQVCSSAVIEHHADLPTTTVWPAAAVLRQTTLRLQPTRFRTASTTRLFIGRVFPF